MSQPGSRAGRTATYITLIIVSGVALFPVFWTVSTSIKQPRDTVARRPKFVSFDPTAKNYRNLFDKQEFTRVVKTTILITGWSTLFSVGAGALMAYALARHRRFPGRRPLVAGLVVVRTIPGIVLMVPLYQVVSRLHLYDKVWVMVVIYAAVNLPFAVWLMTSFIAQIPFELEEAARTEGAGPIAVLLRVVLPLAVPGLAATMIFVALLAWNEFLIPVLLAGDNAKTLPVYISSFVSNRNLDWGPMAAASCLAIVPIALLTIAAQRKLVSGLSNGALQD